MNSSKSTEFSTTSAYATWSEPMVAFALAQEAYSSNRYVPEMLKGARELVVGNNEYVTVEGEDEATYCIAENRQIWGSVTGSVDGLFSTTKSCRLEEV